MSTLNPRQSLAPLLCLVAALAGAACRPVRADDLVELTVMDRASGQALPLWQQRSTRWLEAQPGARFAVRLNNHSGQRVLVVLSVDGINAVTGETAQPGQAGYVLEPYAQAEIAGWRKNLEESAAFYFAAQADSYAARTGRPANTGVIGAVVFRERASLPPMRPRIAAEPAAAEPAAAEPAAAAAKRGAEASSMQDAAASERLGTGHGEREYAPVETTRFDRADNPAQWITLRYEKRERLVALGVIPSPRPRWPAAPQAFPGFVPNPS